MSRKNSNEWNHKNFKKYKMRVECLFDSEILFSAINRICNEWLVEPYDLEDKRSKYSVCQVPDRVITFTARADLTLPMLCWILAKLPNLHIGQESLRLSKEFTSERTPFDEVVVEEPSEEIKALVLAGLNRGHEYWGQLAEALADTSAEFSTL